MGFIDSYNSDRKSRDLKSNELEDNSICNKNKYAVPKKAPKTCLEYSLSFTLFKKIVAGILYLTDLLSEYGAGAFLMNYIPKKIILSDYLAYNLSRFNIIQNLLNKLQFLYLKKYYQNKHQNLIIRKEEYLK